jgi:hypothetical protein
VVNGFYLVVNVFYLVVNGSFCAIAALPVPITGIVLYSGNEE